MSKEELLIVGKIASNLIKAMGMQAENAFSSEIGRGTQYCMDAFIALADEIETEMKNLK